MVHEAMVLEYSGRHLALIELAASLKLVLYVSLDRLPLRPVGHGAAGAGVPALLIGIIAYLTKLAVGGFCWRLFETGIAKMRVFRVPEFLGAALMLGLLATLLLFVSGSLLMHGLAFDIAHCWPARWYLSASCMLYQDRLYALLNTFAAAGRDAGAVGRLAGLHPGRAASLRHGRHRAGLQGDRHPSRAASHDRSGSASTARSRPRSASA